MQLLVEHSEELPVINVVYRGPTYIPPRPQLERAIVPHHRHGDEPSERTPSGVQSRINHQNERHAVSSSLERDNSLEEAATIRSQETRALNVNMAPPPAEGSLITSDPFDDSHEILHLDSTGSLGAYGYNASIQSTYNFSADSFEEPQETAQDIAEMRLQRTLLHSDAEYPEYIRDTLAYVSDLPPARTNYYPLWNHVLEYWFPPTEGFDIVQDWDPNIASFGPHHIAEPLLHINTEGRQRPNPSFAVFDIMFPTQPFLCVNVHTALPTSEFMKIQAQVALEETFETLRGCSSSASAGLRPLCVVSAMGAKWGMVVRAPGRSQNDPGLGFENDCIGEWEDDVTSPESFRVMGYYFREMKQGS